MYGSPPEDVPEYDVLSRKMVRARTPKICAACRETIQAGEMYERHAYIEDGEFHAEVTHGPFPSCPADVAAAREEGARDFEQQQRDRNGRPY